MRSFWRLLLLCLMALALPMQGYAAAGAVHCAALHERMYAAVAADHHHGDLATAGHHHETAPGEHDAGKGSPAGFKCSACAACCVALGLPSTAWVPPAVHAGSTGPEIVSASPAAFLTSGPERPPRLFLA
jgi:hypothetical protein